MEFVAEFPFLAYDLADELFRCEQLPLAIKYYELLRQMPDADSTVLVQLGRCYQASGEHAVAEECFLAAIDADEDSIDARFELANMYEKVREEEEALILAAEAMALREARDGNYTGNLNLEVHSSSHARAGTEHHATRRRDAAIRRANTIRRSGTGTEKHVLPRRYRPKRLAGPDKRQQDEQARAVKLSHQYEVVRELKQQISAGCSDLIPSWMASSKELIDDFRSLKKFYTWDKYLRFLGRKGSLDQPEGDEPKTELMQMYERLERSKPGALFSSSFAGSHCPF